MPYRPKETRPNWIPERKAHERRRKGNKALYNSQAWRRDRAAFLSYFPLCAICESRGLYTAATVSDHVVPINQGGDVWSWDNRQALCDTCHAVKSGKEAHL